MACIDYDFYLIALNLISVIKKAWFRGEQRKTIYIDSHFVFIKGWNRKAPQVHTLQIFLPCKISGFDLQINIEHIFK